MECWNIEKMGLASNPLFHLEKRKNLAFGDEAKFASVFTGLVF